MIEVIAIRDKGCDEDTKGLLNKLWRVTSMNGEIANTAIARSNRGGEALTEVESDTIASYNMGRVELAFLRGDKRFLSGFKDFLDGTGAFKGTKTMEVIK